MRRRYKTDEERREAIKAYDILRKTVDNWRKAKTARNAEARGKRFYSLLEQCTEEQKRKAYALLERYAITL